MAGAATHGKGINQIDDGQGHGNIKSGLISWHRIMPEHFPFFIFIFISYFKPFFLITS